MAKRKSSKRNKGGNKNSSGGRFVGLPRSRLPRWIGSPNLRPNAAIYPMVRLDVPIQMTTLTIAAGVLANVSNIDTSQIPNFATRFGTLFKEFCIVGARFEIRVNTITASPQGMVLSYIDEDSVAAPTATSLDYAHAEIPLCGSSIDSKASLHKIEWKARNYLDLQWTATTATGVVGYLKSYCSASTGTAVGTAGVLVLSGAFSLDFRGYI